MKSYFHHWRKDLPGLAHFLEHMLFTGTAKYPKEGVVRPGDAMNEAWADPGQVSTMSLCSKTVEIPTPILPATSPVTCMVPQDNRTMNGRPNSDGFFDGQMVTLFSDLGMGQNPGTVP